MALHSVTDARPGETANEAIMRAAATVIRSIVDGDGRVTYAALTRGDLVRFGSESVEIIEFDRAAGEMTVRDESGHDTHLTHCDRELWFRESAL